MRLARMGFVAGLDWVISWAYCPGSEIGTSFSPSLQGTNQLLIKISLTWRGPYEIILLLLIGCPPQPVRGIFYSETVGCNLTHSFAVLAKLCFQRPKFANGTWGKNNILRSNLECTHPQMLWIRQCARFDLVKLAKIAWFAIKTLKIFWQNYASKIYLRQNYPSNLFSLHSFTLPFMG